MDSEIELHIVASEAGEIRIITLNFSLSSPGVEAVILSTVPSSLMRTPSSAWRPSALGWFLVTSMAKVEPVQVLAGVENVIEVNRT